MERPDGTDDEALFWKRVDALIDARKDPLDDPFVRGSLERTPHLLEAFANDIARWRTLRSRHDTPTRHAATTQRSAAKQEIETSQDAFTKQNELAPDGETTPLIPRPYENRDVHQNPTAHQNESAHENPPPHQNPTAHENRAAHQNPTAHQSASAHPNAPPQSIAPAQQHPWTPYEPQRPSPSPQQPCMARAERASRPLRVRTIATVSTLIAATVLVCSNLLRDEAHDPATHDVGVLALPTFSETAIVRSLSTAQVHVTQERGGSRTEVVVDGNCVRSRLEVTNHSPRLTARSPSVHGAIATLTTTLFEPENH